MANREEKETRQFKGGLKRLSSAAYCGHAWVHWTMAIQGRKRGWLDSLMHAKIREVLLHALGRNHLVCAGYCLMPDHGHFLIGGLRPAPESDQRRAIALFRKEWTRQIKQLPDACELQKQAHDHVLRQEEYARRDAFETTAGYILENPVKANLVERFEDWEFLGCLVPGYPDLDPREEDFWERFWKVYYDLLVEE